MTWIISRTWENYIQNIGKKSEVNGPDGYIKKAMSIKRRSIYHGRLYYERDEKGFEKHMLIRVIVGFEVI